MNYFYKIIVLLISIAPSFLAAQDQKLEVLNTSINTKFAELGVKYLDDQTILFASSNKTNRDKAFSSNRRKNNRQLFLEIYEGKITEGGDIVKTNTFSKEVYNKFFQCDVTFSPDKRTIYFIWNNYYGSILRKDMNDRKPLFMFKANIDKKFNLSNIEPVPFNSKNYSIQNPVVSNDGKKLFFSSNMEGGYGGFDIYVSSILPNGELTWPKNLGPSINSDKHDIFPFVDENQNLYFASYGHNGKGGLDIFKSTYENGKYSEPKDLPAPINSKYDDFAYVINAKNNTGFFTSSRKSGKGDVDIYSFKPKEIACNSALAVNFKDVQTGNYLDSVLVTLHTNEQVIDKKWIKTNPYQSKLKCSQNYTLTASKPGYEDGELNFGSSKNAKINKTINLLKEACIQQITGLVFNKLNSTLLDSVNVTLSSQGEVVEKQFLRKGYKYRFDINCNKKYSITVNKPKFKSITYTFTTSNQTKLETNRNFLLEPTQCIQSISGVVLEKKTLKPLINAKVQLFKGPNLEKELPLDEKASFKFEGKCLSNYRIVASLTNYDDDVVNINTNAINKNKIERQLYLNPNKEFVIVRKQKMINTKPIYFGLDSADITKESAVELDRVVDILNKYPSITIEVKSHTDSRAPDDYNMKLSNRRAQSTINYIISHGIDSERVFGKGYGETELVNQCKNGVKCSDAEHALNRRTEFIVHDNGNTKTGN
ncbi:MAG: OmpA family protein [Lutibacter sp.]